MASQDQKTSLLLTGGVDDRSESEYVSPQVQPLSAPTLARSVNTRLSPARGTCTRSPGFTSLSASGAVPIYGVVPSVAGAAAAFFSDAGVFRVSTRAGGYAYLGGVPAANDQNLFQSAFRPTQIVQAGAVPSNPARSSIAVCYEALSGVVWYAYASPVANHATNIELYVWATDTSGAALCTPVLVLSTVPPTNAPWVGLTAHGVNGVRLWYMNAADLRMVPLSLSIPLARVTIGTDVSVYTPSAPRLVDVCRYDDTHVAIATTKNGTVADGALLVYDILAATTTSQFFVNATSGSANGVSVQTQAVNGDTYIACAFSAPAAAGTTLGMYTYAAGALTQVWAPQVPALFLLPLGVPAIQFYNSLNVRPAGLVVYAVSTWDGSFDTNSGTVGTTFYALDVLTGAYAGSSLVPWSILANRGETVPTTGGYYTPVFFLARDYGGYVSVSPLAPDYVDDPSIDAYQVVPGYPPACVARFGVVRGTTAPARVTFELLLTRTCVTIGTQLYCTYRKDNYQASAASTRGYYGRYVVLDFGPMQPAVAHDKDGIAMAAAALPFQWDGVEVVEYGGPLHAPHIAAALTGGTGIAHPAGVYSFKAIYQWTDSAGLTHRSRPSATVTVTATLGTEQPIIRVTRGDTLRDGMRLGQMQTLLYATAVNDSTFNLLSDLPTAITAAETYFGKVSLADISAQQLYSITGAGADEIFPQPPPPLWDITIVGSRAWGIDAEYRARLVFSKYRVAGVGFEWAPALEVPFPSGAGKLMAVREWNGQVVVLTERGVYGVSGSGPTNNSGGDTYSSPARISDIGCTSRDSVLLTPAGIVWQYNDWFVLLTDAGVTQFQTIRCTETITGAVLMRNQDEAVFFNGTNATKYVYNYVQQAWTKWDAGTYGHAIQNAIGVPQDTQASLTYAQDIGEIAKITHNSLSTAPSMVWETDWILLGGDWQDSIVLRWVVVKGLSASTHDLTVSLYTNYDTSTATPSTTWTDAELAQIRDAGGRLSVKLEPTEQSTRAFKLVISDTLAGIPGAGFRPGAVTLVWMMDDELLREETFQVSAVSVR